MYVCAKIHRRNEGGGYIYCIYVRYACKYIYIYVGVGVEGAYYSTSGEYSGKGDVEGGGSEEEGAV